MQQTNPFVTALASLHRDEILSDAGFDAGELERMDLGTPCLGSSSSPAVVVADRGSFWDRAAAEGWDEDVLCNLDLNLSLGTPDFDSEQSSSCASSHSSPTTQVSFDDLATALNALSMGGEPSSTSSSSSKHRYSPARPPPPTPQSLDIGSGLFRCALELSVTAPPSSGGSSEGRPRRGRGQSRLPLRVLSNSPPQRRREVPRLREEKPLVAKKRVDRSPALMSPALRKHQPHRKRSVGGGGGGGGLSSRIGARPFASSTLSASRLTAQKRTFRSPALRSPAALLQPHRKR